MNINKIETLTYAQKLADALESMATIGDMGRAPDPKCKKRKAADELRRLDAVTDQQLILNALLTQRSAEDFERIENLEQANAELLSVLVEIVGQINPNLYGYDAAHKAMDTNWRERARSVVAKYGARNE